MENGLLLCCTWSTSPLPPSLDSLSLSPPANVDHLENSPSAEELVQSYMERVCYLFP